MVVLVVFHIVYLFLDCCIYTCKDFFIYNSNYFDCLTEYISIVISVIYGKINKWNEITIFKLLFMCYITKYQLISPDLTESTNGVLYDLRTTLYHAW